MLLPSRFSIVATLFALLALALPFTALAERKPLSEAAEQALKDAGVGEAPAGQGDEGGLISPIDDSTVHTTQEEPPQTVNEAAGETEDTNTVNLGEINDSSSFSVSEILTTTGQNQEYLNDPSGNAPLVAAILDVIEFIIRIVGAIAILLIILGGLYMIISEGSEDKLEKGKTILTSAIIGLVISMFSYLIVRFVQSIFY